MKVKAETVTNNVVDITQGKIYESLHSDRTDFCIIDDDGCKICCNLHECAHLDGGNWTVVEDQT